jgi:serine/threonine-protein kinase HipA
VKDKRLIVTLPGRRVGQLLQDRGGLTRWTPDPDWEAEGQRPRLGIDFLRQPGPKRAGTGLPAWFENLLPEAGSALRKRLCAVYDLRDGQSFALLGASGDDLSGAASVTPEMVSGELGGADGDGEDTGQSVAAVVGRLSSLAGMQLKFSMSMVNDRLALPARGRMGLWIVKFPGAEWDELPEVEAATMTWAREAGFAVPEHFTVSSDRLEGLPPEWMKGVARVFVVRRFDRRADGSKVHQEDLCQALDLLPSNKYGDQAPRVSFDGALRFVSDVCGEAQAREMARRMGFVLASGNSDAHLKNWSLLWGEEPRPVLTPCYDLVSTVAWDTLGWARRHGPELALSIGNEKRFARVDASTLAASALRSGQAWFAEELVAGVQLAREAWPRVSAGAPARMRDALVRHWRSVPLLRSMGLAGDAG